MSGGGSAASGSAPAAAVEEKEEEKVEEKVRTTLTCDKVKADSYCHTGRVRRRYGFRSLRLSCFVMRYTCYGYQICDVIMSHCYLLCIIKKYSFHRYSSIISL